MSFKINMARLLFMFIFCSLNCLILGEIATSDQTNAINSHELAIASVLKYLNSSNFKVYNYKEATLLNAQQKADITELLLDVNVDCLNNYPEIPCTTKTLTCQAFLRNTEILNDVNCKPKPEIIIEELQFDDSNPAFQPKSVSDETISSSEMSEPFVAIRRNSAPPCLGCPFDLNPNAEGVNELIDLGLEHLSNERLYKPTLIKIVKLQQQVVAGIKFILIAEIGTTICTKLSGEKNCPLDTNHPTVICQITYLQKPWISRAKHIISNNCTNSQEFVRIDKTTEMSNDVNGKSDLSTSNFDQIAHDETIDGRLSDLESQILVATTLAPQRQRRAIPQLEKISHEEKPLVKNLADFAANAADNVDDDNYKRVILQILGAKKQSSDNGIYYHLILRMGISKCLEDKPAYENCREKLFENYTKICKVQIYVNDEFVGPKVVKSQCQNIKKDKNDNNRTNYSRFKRKVDDKNDKLQNLFIEGVEHLNSQRNTNRFKPLHITSGSVQLVSGLLYRIKGTIIENNCTGNSLEECDLSGDVTNPTKCQITVWEKKWENFRQFKIKCDDNDKDYLIETHVKNRKKRDVLVGGQNAINVNSTQVQENLNEAINLLNAQRNVNRHKPIEIMSATSQVVAGSLLRIHVKIAETDCEKSTSKNLDECNILKSAEPKECEIKIWEKSWENFKEYTIKCQGDDKKYKIETTSRKRKERSVAPGGQNPIDKNTPEIQAYLNEGLNHLNSQRNLNKHKATEILEATKQVVAGSLLRIKAKVGETDCPKDDTRDLNDCSVAKNATPKECLIKIWEKPWENFKEISVKCEDDEKVYKIQTTIKRRKRSVQLVIDATDNLNDYMLAGLEKLESVYDRKMRILKVLDVKKTSELYRIQVQIIDTNCNVQDELSRDQCPLLAETKPQICKMKIHLTNRQINVSCENDFKSNQQLTFDLFKSFIKKYQKTYTKKEFKYRLKTFTENLERIEELNRNEQGTAIYGITQFADLERNEFEKYLGYRSDLRINDQKPFPLAQIPNIDLPTEFDWRKKGVVTEVKNQQQCGSCWAFSVTGNIEGQYALKHNQLYEFSEQELVDCDKVDEGCNGGLMDTAYKQIIKLGGLETEQNYPYDAEDEKCHFNRSLIKVQLSGAVNISHDETEMAKFLVANGPISIAINANAMQFYFGGVSHPFKFLCNPKDLDHGVLIVGYGVHTYSLFNRTLPYWIVKNSWGTSWGEQGYYRVYRGDGTCGLNQTPSSAIVI